MLLPSDERSERAKRRVGRVLADKWRLERLIGMGGMAAVYAARHVNNEREAALKVLHREFSAKEDVRKRFLREGYIANKIAHPGVVQILDDGTTEDGSSYLVMELFRGSTLQERAAAAPGMTLGPTEVLGVAEKLLDVLAAAHEAQVIHRDLKPENVFVTDEGAVKVLDFGIARLLEPRGDLTTQAGMLVGTPSYMPPEQIAGRNEEVDARSDLWAVGAMMFTLLTGRHVHEAKQSNALLLQAMTAPARKLAELLPDVSPDVARVVDKALSFAREDRYQDARAMQGALREVLAGRAPREGEVKAEAAVTSPEVSARSGLPRRTLLTAALSALGVGAAFGMAAIVRGKDRLRAGGDGDEAGRSGAAGAAGDVSDAAAELDTEDVSDADLGPYDDEDGGDENGGDEDGGDDEGEEEDYGEEDPGDGGALTPTPPPAPAHRAGVAAPPPLRPPVKRPAPSRPKPPARRRRPRKARPRRLPLPPRP